jgi:hypothetical protein
MVRCCFFHLKTPDDCPYVSPGYVFRVERNELDAVVCYNYSIYYPSIVIKRGNLHLIYNKRDRRVLDAANGILSDKAQLADGNTSKQGGVCWAQPDVGQFAIGLQLFMSVLDF